MMLNSYVNPMKNYLGIAGLNILCCGSAIAQTTSNTNNILKDAEKLVAKVEGETIFLDEILEMAKQLPREYQKLSLDTVFPYCSHVQLMTCEKCGN